MIWILIIRKKKYNKIINQIFLYLFILIFLWNYLFWFNNIDWFKCTLLYFNTPNFYSLFVIINNLLHKFQPFDLIILINQ